MDIYSILAFLAVIFMLVSIIMILFVYFHGLDRAYEDVNIPELSDKTVLITGSSAGIGLAAAEELASKGARILMACRNVEKAQKVADEITQNTGNSNIKIYQVELSSMKSVERCASEILKEEERLNILINNAGAGGDPKAFTSEGLEKSMATNYYGHFLLTNLLLDLLKKSAPSRIINMSSSFHIFSPPINTKDLSDLQGFMKYYHKLAIYGQTKLCMILFSVELARRLHGTGVTANALDPGYVQTKIFDDGFLSKIFFNLISFVALTPQQSGRSVAYVATSDRVEGISGRYFLERKITMETPLARNYYLARKLWDTSMRDIKMTNVSKLD